MCSVLSFRMTTGNDSMAKSRNGQAPVSSWLHHMIALARKQMSVISRLRIRDVPILQINRVHRTHEVVVGSEIVTR